MTADQPRRQDVFVCGDDYRSQLLLFVEWPGRWGTRMWLYCLMPKHTHLIVVREKAEGLCRSIGETHRQPRIVGCRG